ncbi:MAG: hypothetical protein ACI90V_011397, partial [Bacillariaceae sp.]
IHDDDEYNIGNYYDTSERINNINIMICVLFLTSPNFCSIFLPPKFYSLHVSINGYDWI